nr:NADH-quinone oxidoreductase subunit J [Rickettsiaceae bacterium]
MEFLFYIFSIFMIFGSIATVSSRSAVHSVLWLIFVFCNAASIFIMVGAEFLAMTLVIVYVGAVAVLFLFVVMMLASSISDLRKDTKYSWFMGSVLLAILVSEMIIVIELATHSMEEQKFVGGHIISSSLSNTVAIGRLLYTEFALPFQIAGVILFIAMVGSIVLTMRGRGGVKRQNVKK